AELMNRTDSPCYVKRAAYQKAVISLRKVDLARAGCSSGFGHRGERGEPLGSGSQWGHQEGISRSRSAVSGSSRDRATEARDHQAQGREGHSKKSRGLLRERVELRFSFMAKHRGIWPMRWMCEALDVSRGGYYAWLKRPLCARRRRDEELTVAIRRSFDDSDRTYGARRVRRDLRAWGQLCGIHRVERLMLAVGLQARRKRRRLPFDTGLRAITAIAPNLLDREFQADGPNQRWVADFTYIWTDEGWLYVAAVLDLFSRLVVGWSMQNQMTARLVSDAMLLAVWRRRPSAELLHHSDQGSQYTSEQFQGLLAQHGVICSMSRSGDCWDNAAMESFFSTLKTERCNRKIYRTRDEARADVFDYIERFYNPRRRHSTLDYLSPLEYEQQRREGLKHY